MFLEKEKDIEHKIGDANKFRRDVSEQNPNSPQAKNIQTPPSQSTCSVTVRARLPKLKLEKFYGSIADWQSFWDAFKNAVHKNCQLSETDKFTYLKGLLGGEAGTAIAGLPLTEGNYGTAIDILKKRFGDEHKIINTHMDKLVKLPPVYNGKDTGRLRKLYDEIEVQIRGLQSMGILADLYGTLLVPILLSKLPDDVKLEMSCRVENGKWKLDDLLKKLIDEITARETCTSATVYLTCNPYLNKLWFSDVCPREENLEVDLLVGADYMWEFMKGDAVRGERDEPVAILTSLGWVLSGLLMILQRQLTTGTNLM